MKRILYLLPLLLALAGCDKESNDVYAGNFGLSVREVYCNVAGYVSPLGKIGLYLDIGTTEPFGHTGYYIEKSVSQNGNTLTIWLGNVIDRGKGGFWVVAPIHTHVELPENITRLIVKSKGRTDQYNLSTLSTLTQVIPVGANSFSSFGHEYYFRRPENTFALISGTYTTNQYLHDEFVSQLLKTIPTLKETEFATDGLRPDSYILPWPEVSDGHYVNFPTRFFTYANPADFDKAGDVLKDFTLNKIASAEEGVTFSLSNFNDKDYYSWMILQGKQ